MKVTETLARYAVETSYSSIPKEVIHQAKRCFLDLTGCALGGSKQPLTRILLKTVKDLGGKPQATIWGHGYKTSVMNAALVNGAMSHALDFDDVNEDAVLHPSCVQVPVAFAVAEQMPAVRGRDLIAAVALAPVTGRMAPPD